MPPKVNAPQMPQETLVRMAGIVTDPCTNIGRGMRDGSCASCVDTATEGGSKNICSVSDFNLKPQALRDAGLGTLLQEGHAK